MHARPWPPLSACLEAIAATRCTRLSERLLGGGTIPSNVTETRFGVINSEHRINRGTANPPLESFGESPKACVTYVPLRTSNE